MKKSAEKSFSQQFIVVMLTCFALLSVSFLSIAIPSSYAVSNGSKTLLVPTQYPTIQSAINAAKAGDTVKVLPGTYTEQLSIKKSITLLGSGVESTTINVPEKLVQSASGFWGVHAFGGANVTISGFTFSSPSKPFLPTCLTILCATIGVDAGTTLYLSSSLVGYTFLIQGLFVGVFNPQSVAHALVRSVDFVVPPALAGGNTSYIGIYVADGTIQLSDSRIVSQPTFHGDSTGIFLDTGSTASILHNTIIGGVPIAVCYNGGACNGVNVRADISYNTIMPTGLSPFGKCGCAAPAGISIGYSSKVKITYNNIIGGLNVLNGIQVFASNNASDPTVAEISHNTISNILCTNIQSRPAGFCGLNFFTQGQALGINVDPQLFAESAGVYPQTTRNAISITDNEIEGTDGGVALYGVENCCTVSNNIIVQSTDYGIAAADGNYTLSNNTVIGGKYGVSAIAGFGTLLGEGASNTTLALVKTTILGTSIARTYIQTISPFTAKVVFKK